MGDVDDDEEKDRQAFVDELILSGRLDGKVEGIAKFYVDKGREALSAKQQHVLDEHVFAPYATKACSRCGHEIPWSEKAAALDNGGRCGYCQHMLERNKEE